MAYRNADITALYERLQPYDTLSPPGGFWIEDSDGGDATGGYDFCCDCGDDHVMRLNLYTPGTITYELMCSDPCSNSDVIPRCYGCGKTLAGWPTDYCETEELAYFEDDDADPTPENVHVVSMVLWNLQWSEDDAKVAAWKAVGKKLVAKLPECAPAAHLAPLNRCAAYRPIALL